MSGAPRSRKEAEAVVLEFATVGSIAERIGVKQNVVSNWVSRGMGFPEPVATMGKAKVWWWPEVQIWLDRRNGS